MNGGLKMKLNKKRKICVITGYRSDYTKLKSVLTRLRDNENIELKIVAFGAHVSGDSGNSITNILEDGFKVSHRCAAPVEGDSPFSMTKSMGLSIIELSSVLEKMEPDLVLLCADRYEILAAAVCASVGNLPIAHIQGGELSGTIDETIRHAITKLSHIHFPSTEQSKNIITQLGEDPEYVFNVGCPAIDHIVYIDNVARKDIKNLPDLKGITLNPEQDYFILIQHSVTTCYEDAGKDMTTTLNALQKIGIQTLLVYPNPDAGSERVVRAIRKHQNRHQENSVIRDCYKNMSFDSYLNLLKNTSCLVGNSSSGIREAQVFGTPVVNIGSRQDDRERSLNVIDVPHDESEIIAAVQEQLEHGRYKDGTDLYGNGTAAEQIEKYLTSLSIDNLVQKKFNMS